MSNLSFIPSVAADKPDQDFQQFLSPQRGSFETDANSFSRYLESVTKDQFKNEQFLRKNEPTRPVESKAFRESVNEVNEDRPEKIDSCPEPAESMEASSETKGTARSETPSNTKEKIAAEDQNQEVPEIENQVTDEQELLDLIANLVVTEAVVQGETTPETVQMAELTEIMVDSELTNVQAITASDGKKLEGAIPVEIDAELPTGDQAEVNVEKKATLTGAIIEDLKPDRETAAKGKQAVNLEELDQVIPQVSGYASPSKGESHPDQDRNQSGKEEIQATVEVVRKSDSNANHTVAKESQTVNTQVNDEDRLPREELSAKAETQFETDRVLASDQSFVKNGKVNLAVIQTQLAVKDVPEVKTEMPTINIISSQPDINNTSQLQTAGSAEVNQPNKEELFSQIVEHAKVVINSGGSEMEVNLKPEHLGKLQLKVTIENEVVTAKFVAESQQVKEIIESNLGQLKRNLQENGMQVDTIMVSVGYHQAGGSFEQTANNRNGFGSFKGSNGSPDENWDSETEDSIPLARLDTVIDLIA